MKIERLSTMIEGEFCAVLIDGVSYHKEVRPDTMRDHKFTDDVAVCKAISHAQAKKIFSRLYADIRDEEIFKITGNFNSYGIMILTDY